MDKDFSKIMAKTIQGFRLPRYVEIPDVGLYLEQVTKYVSQCLEPLRDVSITSSMISNYVKRGLVSNPVKKQYDREQIAYIIYVAVAKNVISLDNIATLLDLQRKSHAVEVAYDYFCEEFENVLYYVFGLKDSIDSVGSEVSDGKVILRNMIITIAHKVYLDMCFSVLKEVPL